MYIKDSFSKSYQFIFIFLLAHWYWFLITVLFQAFSVTKIHSHPPILILGLFFFNVRTSLNFLTSELVFLWNTVNQICCLIFFFIYHFCCLLLTLTWYHSFSKRGYIYHPNRSYAVYIKICTSFWHFTNTCTFSKTFKRHKKK